MALRPLEVLKDRFSTPFYGLGLPAFTRYLYLTGISMEGIITAPPGAEIMIMDGTTSYFVSDVPFSIDNTPSPTEHGVSGEMNPSVRLVTAGTKLYIRTVSTGFVSASFWSFSQGTAIPYRNP